MNARLRRPVRSTRPSRRSSSSPAILFLLALGGCGDGSVSSEIDVDEIRAEVTLLADLGARAASAVGRVDFIGFEPDDIDDPEGIRLIDGDYLAIVWDGAEYRLRRGEAAYRYGRSFDLPAGREPEMLFRIVSGGRGPVTRRVVAYLPDVGSFEMLERESTVASDASLTLSWNLDLDGGPAREQVLETLVAELSPRRCTDANGVSLPMASFADLATRRTLAGEAMAADVPLADVFEPLRAAGAVRCRYEVRLEATSSTLGFTAEGQGLELRSVTVSAPALVEVVAAGGAGAGR